MGVHVVYRCITTPPICTALNNMSMVGTMKTFRSIAVAFALIVGLITAAQQSDYFPDFPDYSDHTEWIDTTFGEDTNNPPVPGEPVLGDLEAIDTSAKRAEAVAIIEALPTGKVQPHTSYNREVQFGTSWTDSNSDPEYGNNGCDTRNDILARDFEKFTQERDCKVIEGTFHDPYTGQTIQFVRGRDTSMAVQIDHVFSLSSAWHHGASNWSQDQRMKFANDPLNLLASDGPANQTKSDKGPGGWMPDQTAIHCEFSARYAEIATAYQLHVDQADKNVMLDACD